MSTTLTTATVDTPAVNVKEKTMTTVGMAATIVPSDAELLAAGWAKALDPNKGDYYYFTLDRKMIVWENPLVLESAAPPTPPQEDPGAVAADKPSLKKNWLKRIANNVFKCHFRRRKHKAQHGQQDTGEEGRDHSLDGQQEESTSYSGDLDVGDDDEKDATMQDAASAKVEDSDSHSDIGNHEEKKHEEEEEGPEGCEIVTMLVGDDADAAGNTAMDIKAEP
jgi:hypothetical protein